MTISVNCDECGIELGSGKDLEDLDPLLDEDEQVCEACKPPQFDFPYWVEIEHYDDHHEMWRSFCRQIGIEDAGDLPEDVSVDASDMKYCVFSVYFKVTEGGVEGPYDSKRGEKL